MTNIYTGYGQSPAVCTMFDKSKGSFGNRIDCTAHKMANNATANAETGLLGVATIAGYKAINKTTKGKASKLNKYINSVLKKGAKLYQNTADKISKAGTKSGIMNYVLKGAKGICNVLKSGFEKLAKTGGRQKLLGMLGIAAVTTLVAINRKHAYNEGKIEQKYNDIAARQTLVV